MTQPRKAVAGAVAAAGSAILNLLEFGTRARRGNAPTSRLRWCTAYGKTALFDAYVRRNRANLGEQAVLISGEQWAESDSRAKVAQMGVARQGGAQGRQ